MAGGRKTGKDSKSIGIQQSYHVIEKEVTVCKLSLVNTEAAGNRTDMAKNS